MVSWQSSYGKLRSWLSLLRRASRSELLSQDGLGPTKVDRILTARAEAETKRRPFTLRDLIEIKGAGKSLFSGDASAAFVAKFITCYEERFSHQHHMWYPDSILSIDLGKVNAAYCLVDQHYSVQAWSMLDLSLPSPYTPGDCYENVKQSLETLPVADAYILEEQSHRYRSKEGFLAVGIELRCLEAMVYATLKQLRGDTVCSIPPLTIASYFDIGRNKKSSSNTKVSSSSKKTEAVLLVKDIIENKWLTPLGHQVTVPQNLVNFFNSCKKKDDLSDCLLQSVAMLDWRNMSRHL